MGAGRINEACARYQRAQVLAPESDELLFWAGLALAQGGDLDKGVDAVRRAAEVNPGWLVLLDRLELTFAPAGEAVRRALAR
jgi:Flp pilus assembly protein TadD